MDIMERWFLVYCKPGQDTRAEENLIRQGFNVYRPKIGIVENKSARQKAIKYESLFPRYIFLKIDPSVTSVAPVLCTLGVTTLVKFGKRYATASDELIEDIMNNANKQIEVAQDQPLKTGDKIYSDVLGSSQINAIYCYPCGNKRAMILANIIGKESKLSVPIESIYKATG